MKRVYGNYSNLEDAEREIKNVIKQGYEKDQIIVISNQEISDKEIKNQIQFNKYNEGFWNGNILGEEEKGLLKEYKDNLESGEIILLLNGSPFKEPIPDWDEREKEFYED